MAGKFGKLLKNMFTKSGTGKCSFCGQPARYEGHSAGGKKIRLCTDCHGTYVE